MAQPLPAPPEPRERGLLASVRRLIETLLATLQTRMELVSREFERERIRVTRLALLAVVALFFLTLGSITATIFIIVLFWESQRLVAIGFLTALYFGIAIGIALFAKGEAGRAARPFAATVEQLKKDREQFGRH